MSERKSNNLSQYEAKELGGIYITQYVIGRGRFNLTQLQDQLVT